MVINMEIFYNQQIADLWDLNLRTRIEDLEEGTDLTYTNVIMPWVLSNIPISGIKRQKILDIGCGCGYLSNAVYRSSGAEITGIDISPLSISYAQQKYPSLTFECRDLYNDAFEKRYNTALAVMVLNNMPNLNRFFSIVYNALETEGKLIITIPHPVFWARKHLNDFSFSYTQEQCYSIPFATKGRSDYAANILYFHRPLSSYLNCIIKAGFYFEQICELRENTEQEFPDLLGIIVKK